MMANVTGRSLLPPLKVVAGRPWNYTRGSARGLHSSASKQSTKQHLTRLGGTETRRWASGVTASLDESPKPFYSPMPSASASHNEAASSDTLHPLTIWDCERLYLGMTPIIAWAVHGDVDIGRMASALRQAVAEEAPWLGGRLVIREKQSPKYAIRAAPEGQFDPFEVTSLETPGDDLHEILPNYIPPGLAKPCVKKFDINNIECLQPLAAFSTHADEAARQGQRLMHLHFVRARDLTLVCVGSRHIVLDATALRHIVARWEEILTGARNESNSTNSISGRRKANLDKFMATVNTDSTSHLPGWSKVKPLDYLALLARSKLDGYKYPASFGYAYVPKKIVQVLTSRVSSELGPDVKISRNDVVAAWFYKTAYSVFPPGTETTLSRAVNVRGRHELIPRDVSGNVLGLAVMPSIDASSLGSPATPLAQLALASRQSVMKFTDPEYVARFSEFLAYRAKRGVLAVPGSSPRGRRCLVSSFVNIGLSSPNFGGGASVRAAMHLTMDPVVTRVIDDAEGGFRIHARLPLVAWEAVESALEVEDRE